MKRIDAPGHDGNRFVGGNPLLGVNGTIVSPDWLNNVQEELATVVEVEGGTLDGTSFDQVHQAITGMVLRLTGSVLDFVAGSNLTAGDVHLEGDALGIVAATVTTGNQARLILRGIFTLLPKAAGEVWSPGDAVYWTGTAFTKTAAGNRLAGIAAAAALLADTVGSVTLKGPPSLV